jgi:hypothetical protein
MPHAIHAGFGVFSAVMFAVLAFFMVRRTSCCLHLRS